MFSKGLACGNLPEINDASGMPRFVSVSGKSLSAESFCFQKVLLVEISQKSLICLEFQDLLTRNQGFREELENPSFPGYPGG